jgi:ribose 5-phosphate isomerase B
MGENGKLHESMKIFIGSDRIGFELKAEIIQLLYINKHEVIDIGPLEFKSVHYPEIAVEVSRNVIRNLPSIGILICSSGIGMSIAANKIRGIRAANCTSDYLAEHSRLHNDANILCLGSTVIKLEDAIIIVKKFLSTPFESGKHSERVQMINNITT